AAAVMTMTAVPPVVVVSAIVVPASAPLPPTGRVDPAVPLALPARLNVDVTAARVHGVAFTPNVPPAVPLPMPFDPDGVALGGRRPAGSGRARRGRGLTHDDDPRLAPLRRRRRHGPKRREGERRSKRDGEDPEVSIRHGHS